MFNLKFHPQELPLSLLSPQKNIFMRAMPDRQCGSVDEMQFDWCPKVIIA